MLERFGHFTPVWDREVSLQGAVSTASEPGRRAADVGWPVIVPASTVIGLEATCVHFRCTLAPAGREALPGNDLTVTGSVDGQCPGPPAVPTGSAFPRDGARWGGGFPDLARWQPRVGEGRARSPVPGMLRGPSP